MATIVGTAGNDRLSGTGNTGVDDVLGLGGDDVLMAARPNNGGAGTVNLYGGDGNDRLFGIDESDYTFSNFIPAITNMYGESGDDVLTIFRLRSNVIDGGIGVDTLVHNVGFQSRGTPPGYTLGLTIDLAAGTWNNGSVTGIENVTGSAATADILLGDDGDNVLKAEGFDTRTGATGEVVSGRGGNDTLSGGNGADLLDGGSGIDTMTGGIGDDVYIVDDSRDVVIEEQNQGVDEVRSTANFIELYAGVENLTFIGTTDSTGWGNNYGNVITGGVGNDTLYGFDGADTLRGSDGNDSLYGGTGSDFLDGGTGSDLLAGGEGDDVYIIDSEGDSLFEATNQGFDVGYFYASSSLSASDAEIELAILRGQAKDFTASNSDNQVIGNELDNRIDGLAGNDDLNGREGRDELHGGAGNDRLDGGTGADTMFGDAGDDIYVVDDAGDIATEYHGQGYDRLFTSTSYDLALTSEIEAIILTESGLRVSGSNTANMIVNSGASSTMYGLGGDDYLLGGWGSDNLYGGDGNDRLEGLGGADNLQGGAGNDIYIVDQQGDEIIEFANQGDDTGYFATDYQLISNVELELAFMQGAARRFLASNTNNQVVGNDLDNQIFGFGGDDNLRGGAGADELNGGDGADLLDGGSGADVLIGGDGDDVYVVDNSNDQITEGAGRGNDRLFVSVDYRLAADADVETIILTSSGTVFLGNDQANLIVTAGLANILDGRGGDDVIRGGAGDDRLVGGLGRDTLFGGEGADQFHLDLPTGASADRIEDFHAGVDRITAYGAEYGLAAGALDASRFSLDTASGTQGQFIYEQNSHKLFWDPDGTGAAAAAEVASFVFAGNDTITASDFLII